MGPPINVWPYSHPVLPPKPSDTDDSDSKVTADSYVYRKSLLANFVDNFRVFCLNFTLGLLFLQLFFNLHSVRAGPVVLSLDYLQGPVPIARNIKHLPCISRRTGQEGMCMFAIDCLKANGTHLGTCIDRFYFGSCCQVPDKTLIPQITENNIEDNSIDSANFVHPQTEDKYQEMVTKHPEKVFPSSSTTLKPVTEKLEDKTDSINLETKIDEHVIPLEGDKVTTAAYIESATKVTGKVTQTSTTEEPKLSTFQSVDVTDKPYKPEAEKITTTTEQVTTQKVVKPTRKPTKPTYKPRPTYKPVNFTRPSYLSTSPKPKPSKPPPNYFNTTRKPPYRPPPKRPTTRRPIPIPPRLNITILPQSTSTRPLFTRPSSISITHITNTATSALETSAETKTPSSTTTSTTTEAVTTTSTASPISSSSSMPLESLPKVETTTLTTTLTTEPVTELATEKVTEKVTEAITDIPLTTQEDKELTTVEEEKQTTLSEITTQKDLTEAPTSEKINTIQETVSEKETTVPLEVEATTQQKVVTTDYPPFVTWSNTIDGSKPAENVTEADEVWSPITPPAGWILISTIPPKPETTTTTTTTTEAPKPQTTEKQEESTEYDTERPITETPTSISEFTEPISNNEPIEAPSSSETYNLINQSVSTEDPFKEDTPSETPDVSSSPIQPLTTSEIPSTSALPSTSEQPSSSSEIPSSSPNLPSSSSEVYSTSSEVPSLSSELPQLSSEASITEAESEKQPQTTSSMMEFTVNVTLTPTSAATTQLPVSVSSTEISSTEGIKVESTSASTEGSPAPQNSTTPSSPASEATTVSPTTPEPFNYSNYKEVCGRRLWPQARIVGGAKSSFGKWPWQISLRQFRTSTYLHKCGAALLNENWAITAAHCVEHVPPSELLVRLGEYDLATEDEPYGFAERRVQIVASHPHFDPATFEYDLALLRFYEPVTFQPNIIPVCVPDSDENYVGKTAYVTGWGRLYDEGPLPSVLQEVSVPVINNTACEAMYRAAGYNEHIPNIFICAGWKKGGSDSCEGDSGGPMVVPRERDGRFVLGGVISWGIGCAEPNQPGVYTRISEFRDWINQILQF